ncbi:Capsule biosynthesis protein capA [Fulvivirga imtechensis AK7]|uniref:Capsule biosynthesis protein capA n=1 Tax=Fulvivirga imtechensis AK7 TaxID=1237149 RepID=L8JW58_9BACT|nr:CapA family protein [Fulvivirga imtechensis]ELR73251.1 Capsule biosynthesis protein capA [Fulvivirga imtechensis AK7]
MLWRLLIVAGICAFLPAEKPGAVNMKAVGPLLQEADGITLFLSGDVMTGRGIDQILNHSVNPILYESYVKDATYYVQLAESQNGNIDQPVSPKYIWGDALKVWSRFAPAAKIINLETSITNNEQPWPGKGINYRMHPKNINVLTEAGINVVSLANNHTLDWEISGLVETLRTLEAAGILYAGAGRNTEEAQKPAILQLKKGRILVFAYGAGSSGVPAGWGATTERSGICYLREPGKQELISIKEQVSAEKRSGDVVVFSVHWGSNWGYDIPSVQREFAHQLIDRAGVDIVHGHSSHHPRGIEVYHGKLIIYGAGDFINDYEGIEGYEQFRDDLALMYFPVIEPSSGKLLSMQMVPMHIKNMRLNNASKADIRWIQYVLDRESRKLGAQVVLTDEGTLSLQW